MSKKLAEECIGFITGKCPYTDNKTCSERKKEECHPPICENMTPACGKVFCEASQSFVDPVEVCLKCNPKDYL